MITIILTVLCVILVAGSLGLVIQMLYYEWEWRQALKRWPTGGSSRVVTPQFFRDLVDERDR